MMEPLRLALGRRSRLNHGNEVLADAQADKFPTTTAEFEAATLQMEAIRNDGAMSKRMLTRRLC